MRTPDERRRIIGLVNEGIASGMNLKEIVRCEVMSLEDARWYRNYMTPERQEDVNRTHAGLNTFIVDGQFEHIDFDKLFEGFDETVPWSEEGF